MSETRKILEALRNGLVSDGSVLATVVDVVGSSYRLPGAKMLVLSDGGSVGTVSGGCLEADLLERTKAVSESGKPATIVYDTRKETDSVFSLNMGCRGVVTILVEPALDNPLFGLLERNISTGAVAVVATGIGERNIGARRIVWEDDQRTTSEGEVPAEWMQFIEESFAERASFTRETTDGAVFVEYFGAPVSLAVFGAGGDVAPLIRIASGLGWRTMVSDHRPAFAVRERFPEADEVICRSIEEIAGGLELPRNTHAVVMTHNYEHDRTVLSALLSTDTPYIGMMGPKSRTESIIAELRESGSEFSSETLSRIHGPVGLDIGGRDPESIALSIVAEIQSVASGRTGGFLRERSGSIYGRKAEIQAAQ
ncbi:MAG: XdhC family protein [Pyrinomonadaceae bacterium]